MKASKLGYVLLFSAVSVGAAAEEGKSQGRVLYEENCGTCHQMDGGGVPMLQPELIDRPRANGPKGGIIDVILLGSEALAISESDYSNEMPSFSQLSDIEIALIASYIRTNFENNGGPVTAEDVRARRPK